MIKNLYVKKFKEACESYYTKALQLKKEMQRNVERYQPEVANEENEKLKQQLQNEYEKAKNSIISIFEDIRTCYSMGSYPNVESLTADRMFFDGTVPFSISENEMKAFVDRYNESSNFVMLRVIDKYIEERNAGRNVSEWRYTNAKNSIIMPEQCINTYKMFAEGALSMLNTINDSPETFSKQLLDAYADDYYNAQNFAVIGTGSSISNFKSMRLPESAKHLYDSITVNSDKKSNGFTAHTYVH